MGPEALQRAEADRLIGRLCLTTAQLITLRVEADLEAARKGERGQMTTGELALIHRDVTDRKGAPRRSQTDIVMEKSPPILVMAPLDSWQKREDEHAAAADAGSHGLSDRQH